MLLDAWLPLVVEAVGELTEGLPDVEDVLDRATPIAMCLTLDAVPGAWQPASDRVALIVALGAAGARVVADRDDRVLSHGLRLSEVPVLQVSGPVEDAVLWERAATCLEHATAALGRSLGSGSRPRAERRLSDNSLETRDRPPTLCTQWSLAVFRFRGRAKVIAPTPASRLLTTGVP